MLHRTVSVNMGTVCVDHFIDLFLMPSTVVGFDEGSPDGYDPLQVARAMAREGITLVASLLFTASSWSLIFP